MGRRKNCPHLAASNTHFRAELNEDDQCGFLNALMSKDFSAGIPNAIWSRHRC
jgi:hypothetical protein